jgi:opacity protein-like surface antigen
MMRRLMLPILAAMLLAGPAHAADAADATAAAGGMFSRPVVLRGTLGDAQIQMKLQPKSDPAEGIEGEYIVFGRSGQILLAGETESGGLLMEESENGTDVSGQWEGQQDGAAVRGTWQSADGSVNKPFVLTPMDSAASPVRSQR